MDASLQLWLFFIMVFGVVLLPGLDMAFVLASALTGGRRSGFAATFGIIAGGICHVFMGALGIMAVLQVWPALFNLMLILGAGYIAWIGAGLLRSSAVLSSTAADRQRGLAGRFGQGMLTSLLNPKAYLFMLAIFPQFIRPEQGQLWTQAGTLWLIIALTQLLIYGAVALAGDRTRQWLSARPAAERLLARSVGLLLLATAIYTCAMAWRSVATD
jgi:threonine/homoserine/homoserine lactone efflux protein